MQEHEGRGSSGFKSNTSLIVDAPVELQSLVRLAALLEMTGLSRATAYRYSKSDPAFPKPIKLSDSTARNAPVAYRLQDIQSWIAERAKNSGL